MLIRGNLGRNRLDIQSGCLNDEKHLTVSAAATRSPREMPRRWESVQEEELKEEREVEGSALLDGPGEVWHWSQGYRVYETPYITAWTEGKFEWVEAHGGWSYG